MLSTTYIRDNKKQVLEGLAKRNFKDAEKTIDSVLDTDERKRAAQTALDQVLAESNKLSKEIGVMFKSGEVQKANIAPLPLCKNR